MSMVGDLIGGLFGVSKPKAPPAPDVNAMARDTDAQAQAEQARLARGRTSTILTGSRGLDDLGEVKKNNLTSGVLLGS